MAKAEATVTIQFRNMEAWIADVVRRRGWTTTKPTEPGWYWVQAPGEQEEEILLVQECSHTPGLEYSEMQEEGWMHLDTINPLCQWQGPIRPNGPVPVPEKPEG